MKNYTDENRTINTDNLFNINSELIDIGKANFTIADYKRENLENINKYLK